MKEFLLQLIHPRELFSLKPPPINGLTFQILAVFFGLFVLVAIIFLILAQTKKKDYLLAKVYNKFFALFLTVGLIGLFYSWLAFENVVVLSARFIFVILILVFLVWFGFILRFRFVKVPRIKKEVAAKKDFEKYLP